MVTCIILAAGKSLRFGSPKACALLKNNKTLLENLISTYQNSKVNEIIIVVGANKEQVIPLIPGGVKIFENKNFELGQTSSLKIGLQNLSDKCTAFFVQPVDTALIKEQTINCLIKNLDESKKLIAIPSYQGKKGHPPLYDIKLKEQILNLSDTDPLYLINRQFTSSTIIVEVKDAGVITNINTPEDLNNL